ncbi:MAG: hypothetical protein Q8P18_02420 [Pseudomonadota bacterium]|nr:hypothetical protein [Pseudomonadota bacterium]
MTPILRASFGILALAAIPACVVVPPSEDKGEDSASACAGPSVVGSADQSITLGAAAAPTASGAVCTSGDEAILTWVVESAPVDSAIDTSDLDISDPATPSFVPDVVGTYVVSVTASDSSGAVSAADYIVITVASGNAAPLADCGNNVTAEVDQRVDLDGSASSDPEGAALEYQWSLSSVPSCSGLSAADMFNASTVNPSVVPDCAGVFVVGLAVTDGSNWSGADFCSITVASTNAPPVADAGDSSALSPCTDQNFELDGYGSYDPEGADLSYAWSLLTAPSGSTASFAESEEALANPVFHWDMVGTYTFELRVNDGTYDSPPDIVSYTFTDESANNRPIANAGEDQTIVVAAECDTASYVFTCADCPQEDVTLDGTASDDPIDGDDVDFLWSDASGELTIASRYSPETQVLTPSFPATYNVATTRGWDVVLSVSDCADTDTDIVKITYTCTGEYSP